LPKILVVEDEESVRQALRKILESFGHKVFDAGDGPDAIRQFEKEGDIDIVLTDLSLPGPSGWDVADQVKKRSPKTPVILLSGWDITEEELRQKDNVSRVLSKPVKINDMLKAINELTAAK
jgi:two-component system chemotaxis response regulator CheY